MRIVELQRAGKQPMKADEFLRGTPVAPGTVLRLNPCRATSSPSNTTARRSSAGRCRTTARRCRARSTAAIKAFTGERCRACTGAGRTDAGVHALGQVAHVDLAKDWDTDKVRDAINLHLRPHPIAVLAAERVAEDFRRALLGDQAALSLPHRQPPRRSRARARPRLARAASARCRGDARRGASARSASTTSPPSAPPSARRNRR